MVAISREEQEFLSSISGKYEHTYEALIKLKLVHAEGFSLLLPDLIAADINGWKWFQPKFFTACSIAYLDDFSIATLAIDFSETGSRFLVNFTSSQFVSQFDDGSHLYRCMLAGPPNLAALAAGTCSIDPCGEVILDLFHHTTPDAVEAIRQSGNFRASRWNVQGNQELENVGYAYFTNLSAIRSDQDLMRIAMASDGKIRLLPTNAHSRRDAISIEVYRESTLGRCATINVAVPASIVASQHIYRHAPHGQPVYYETCHPEIFRVGLLPGRVLPFEGQYIRPASKDLKRFDYVVLGDADTARGLAAPYNEEHTDALFLVERCSDETFFDFWQRNANIDKVTGRPIELMAFRQVN